MGRTKKEASVRRIRYMFLEALYLLKREESSMVCTVFADASKEAYCATVYLVCKLHYTACSNLVVVKTRLPPMKKKMTMSRLESTAARLAVRLATSVKEAL